MQHTVHFTEAQLLQIVLHRVGNKHFEEGIRIAQSPLQVDDELRTTLKNYFLGSFQTEAFYQFYHDNDLMMNEVYAYASYIFDDASAFYEQSVHILRHLYEKSTHNKIQAGELYVAQFKDCIFDDELVEAIGIFKTETKDKFIKLAATDSEDGTTTDWALTCDEGTNLARLDKGCLIIKTAADTGFRVLTVDVKSADAKYWLDEFLKLRQVQDDAFLTKNYLNMCKDFTRKVLAKEDKNEQLSFVNKSLDYFETKETFDYNEFVEDVFEDQHELVDKFEHHRRDYNKRNGIASPEPTADSENDDDLGFFIAPQAVKKAKKGFKNSIQLDTQVEIKIQSAEVQDSGCMERGYDEDRKMHFYKIFFNEEK